jgi:predicted adenylyl cyclase CyaB
MTPHRELELKAVVPDPDQFRRRIGGAGAVRHFAGRMTDVRFDREADLSLRDEVLRVRTFHHPDGRTEALVAWKGPTLRSPEGYKLREEIELPVAAGTADPGRLFLALGYRPVGLVEREVEIYRLGDATVRLETYPRMDVLVEIEGEPAAIERAVAASGIARAEFTAEPLAEFVRRFEQRSGQPALLATG